MTFESGFIGLANNFGADYALAVDEERGWQADYAVAASNGRFFIEQRGVANTNFLDEGVDGCLVLSGVDGQYFKTLAFMALINGFKPWYSIKFGSSRWTPQKSHL